MIAWANSFSSWPTAIARVRLSWRRRSPPPNRRQPAGQMDAAANARRCLCRSQRLLVAKGELGRVAEMDGGNWNVEMIVALEEQVECYRRLEKLSQRQHEQVQQGSTDGLIEVLE